MRILHVVPYYAPAWAYGGVVRAVSGLAAAQAANGHRVTVLTTDTLTPTERIKTAREVIDSVEVIRCRNWIRVLRRINLSSPVGMRRAFQLSQPDAVNGIDVIHCHELRTVENLIVTPAARVPLILSPHGTLPVETGRAVVKRVWDQLFGRVLASRFKGVIALTEQEAQDIRTLFTALKCPFPPIGIIPNGVATSSFSASRWEKSGDQVNLLFMGRLHERKGLQYLIPAFAQANIPNARLLIVGPDEGMLTRAEQMVADYGIADRVIFTGFLTGEAQRTALASADLFVLPAVGEGLSMAALEAMAGGLPVILTPGCNLPEVEARGAGLVVPREIEPLAAAIRALLTDPGQRARMGAAARVWMSEAYDWSTIAARVTAFYQQISSENSG